MNLQPQPPVLTPIICRRIHGWLAPLVDAPTLHAVALADQKAQAPDHAKDVIDRVLALLTEKPMTAKEIAAALEIGEKSAKNALNRLGKRGKIEGEFGPMVGKRCVKVYQAVGL